MRAGEARTGKRSTVRAVHWEQDVYGQVLIVFFEVLDRVSHQRHDLLDHRLAGEACGPATTKPTKTETVTCPFSVAAVVIHVAAKWWWWRRRRSVRYVVDEGRACSRPYVYFW